MGALPLTPGEERRQYMDSPCTDRPIDSLTSKVPRPPAQLPGVRTLTTTSDAPGMQWVYSSDRAPEGIIRSGLDQGWLACGILALRSLGSRARDDGQASQVRPFRSSMRAAL